MVHRGKPDQTRARGLLLQAGAAAILFAAAPLAAQTVTLSPIANLSLPTKVSLKRGTLHVSQKIGFRVGAQMTVIFSDRFDIASAVTYSPGFARLQGAGKRLDLTSGSHSLAGSSSARYWLRPRGGPLSWEVHTGVGMVFGGTPSYLDLFESSTLNAVLGSSVRYRLGHVVTFTVKVQQRLLKLRFGEQDSRTSPPLRVTFGVGFPILERLR